MARLLERFNQHILPELRKELGKENVMSLPRLEKIVLSMGVGQAVTEKKRMEAAVRELSLVSGQKAIICKAKKSVSNFKVRKGYSIGCMVTLRGRRMFEFLDRLINTAIPRLRDFRGLNPRSFDGRGNYSMGVPDQTIFPEIDLASMPTIQGMNITFVTTARSDTEGHALLRELGMPFRRAEGQSDH